MPDKRQIVGKTEEQLKQEARARREEEARLAAATPKSKITQKRENFWYHYKWHTIIGVAVLVVAAFFLHDALSRTNPDATIVMVSEKDFPLQSIELLGEEIGHIASDFNGDNKVDISVNFITLPSDGNDPATAQMDYANNMKLTAVLAAGGDPLYLLDEAAYLHLVRIGLSEGDAPDTDNIFIAENVPANVFDLPEFSDMRFYLRKGFNGNENYYQYCGELLKTIDRS